MIINRNIKEIKLNKFFAGVNDSVINSIFKPEYFKTVSEGDIIYQTGDEAEHLYLLLRGDVKIKFPSHHYISNKIFNDFFGEKELMEKTLRISSAVANSKCLLFLIDKKNFEKLVAKSPATKNNIETYGDIELPESESVTNGRIDLTETAKPISFRAAPLKDEAETSSPDDSEEKIENNSESITETISNIIEEESIGTDLNINSEEIIVEEDIDVLNIELDGIDGVQIDSDTEIVEEIVVEPETAVEQIDIQRLLDILIVIHNQLTVYETVRSIINGLKILTSSEAGEVFLIDELAGMMTRHVDEINVVQHKISDGLTGTCALQKKILNFETPTEDSRFIPEIDQPPNSKTKNIIYVPLINRNDEIVGVLQLAHGSKQFSEFEIEQLKLITPQAALALERSKRVELFVEDEKQMVNNNLSKFLTENISTPVDVINRYTLLLNNEEFSEKVKEIISMLQKQANLFPDIIQSAFNYDKSDFALNMEKIKINSYMNSISELLSEYCDTRNVNLFQKLGEEAEVNIDSGKLFMALYQVVKNSCDVIEQDGNLYISTEQKDGYIKINVRDEGPGIPDEIKENIFNTSFSEDKGRNNFGLAITKKIIELHKGHISFTSNPDDGTTFTFSIPVHTEVELISQFEDSKFQTDTAELPPDDDNNVETE
jgi:signal transduction histidine kinase